MSAKKPERILTPVQKKALRWLLAEGGRVRLYGVPSSFKVGRLQVEHPVPVKVCGAAVRELCNAGAIVFDGEWIEVTQCGCKQATA